jgi:hypothetical protein
MRPSIKTKKRKAAQSAAFLFFVLIGLNWVRNVKA